MNKKLGIKTVLFTSALVLSNMTGFGKNINSSNLIRKERQDFTIPFQGKSDSLKTSGGEKITELKGYAPLQEKIDKLEREMPYLVKRAGCICDIAEEVFHKETQDLTEFERAIAEIKSNYKKVFSFPKIWDETNERYLTLQTKDLQGGDPHQLMTNMNVEDGQLVVESNLVRDTMALVEDILTPEQIAQGTLSSSSYRSVGSLPADTSKKIIQGTAENDVRILHGYFDRVSEVNAKREIRESSRQVDFDDIHVFNTRPITGFQHLYSVLNNTHIQSTELEGKGTIKWSSDEGKMEITFTLDKRYQDDLRNEITFEVDKNGNVGGNLKDVAEEDEWLSSKIPMTEKMQVLFRQISQQILKATDQENLKK